MSLMIGEGGENESVDGNGRVEVWIGVDVWIAMDVWMVVGKIMTSCSFPRYFISQSYGALLTARVTNQNTIRSQLGYSRNSTSLSVN